MKKLFLSFLLVSAFALNDCMAGNIIEGQSNSLLKDDSGSKCFDENSKVLNLGVGFASASYYRSYRGKGYNYRSSPAFSLSYEQALKNKLGPGFLGIGAYLGYQSSTARYNNSYYNGGLYYYEHKWKSYTVAARAAYHLDFLNSERAEIYAGVTVGVNIRTYRYETNSPDPNSAYYSLSNGAVAPAYSAFLGARWYFTQNIGLFGELGSSNISWGTLGFSFKL
ncbi:MAG: hypothetical protein JWO09_2513 [Bacteroidetes bacterium]|nr:hypothetical protein [Bacteroidota bacterium]